MGNASVNGERLFSNTFQSFVGPQVQLTIPTGLFANVDLSGVTNYDAAFNETFRDLLLTETPEGIFHDGCLAQNSQSQYFYMTFSTGGIPNPGGTLPTTVLKDPFANMTDFSWVNASNASTQLFAMFQRFAGLGGRGTYLTGSASTVLQHFNFTPTNYTRMFQGQTLLTDYNTINANWK